jgi:hypothetical protein
MKRISPATLAALLALALLPAPAQAIQMWGDTEIGDCTFAAAANWEEAALHRAPSSEAELVRDFHQAGGRDELGATSAQLFHYWHRIGIGGVRVTAHRRRGPAPLTIAGLNVHGGEEWAIVNPGPEEGPTWPVGAEGGHMVLVLAIGRRGPIIVSWGTVLQMTWKQWHRSEPEVWSPSVVR